MNKKKKPQRKNGRIVLRLFSYIIKIWYLFIPALIMTLLSNQLSLLGPKYSGEAIDAIAVSGGINFNLVWQSIMKMLLCYLISAVLSYILASLMIYLSQRIVYTMRKQLFEKLTSLPVG
ncbi:MAG: ABC transporter ATP-binding protein, partial [Clostridia bacterium]|nr:ABC transporter ATP-binding protein [Clostridia bacterium]